jgi:copper chaperone CopZ
MGAGAMTETRFDMRGMKCNGCIAKARAAVSKLPGFVDAEFDLKAGTGTIRGDVEAQAVIRALAAAGYPATIKVA